MEVLARRPQELISTGPSSLVPAGLGEAPGMGMKAQVDPTEASSPFSSPSLPMSHSRADSEGPPAEDEDSLGLALQLLRSETVKVYVNNEINILASFF